MDILHNGSVKLDLAGTMEFLCNEQTARSEADHEEGTGYDRRVVR